MVSLPAFLLAQSKVTLDPTISPALFAPGDQITVTYNVTGTSLVNLTDAYIWVWIPGKGIDARHNINPANSNPTQTVAAKFNKTVAGGQTTFSLTFTPAAFFTTDISNESQLGILLKGNDWSNGQTTDYITNFGYKLTLTSPLANPVFVNTGGSISIQVQAPVASTFETFVDDVLVHTSGAAALTYSYLYTVSEASGAYDVRVVGTSASGVSEVSFLYLIRESPIQEVRPPGISPGINYNPSDHTVVTLCLWAPEKTSVYVRGDFSDWDVLPENLMKKDGDYFWLELTGLTEDVEYAYQYLVNETLWVADPYADKILDPDDQHIPASTYPNLKTYPHKAFLNDWYFNRLSVFQTNQTPYVWQATDYQRPPKEKLVIYELLIRDFFGPDHRNYQTLIDTLSYLKRLGVNAIELMPIMEFNGNESWGYNPTFMFAPDKYYGTKNKLKEFIDVCHQNGIAVILDIAMNHQDIPNAYVMMDFNFTTFKPTAQNKWFNTDARHPFNVFFDMNHESSYTKSYLDTVNHYWLNEYKVDGFRFDLSKGFTQVNSGGNVSAWSSYDASRVALLKRMADKIWEHTPDAYVILEHFAANNEEKELAEYRAGEGKGMLFWGNLNHAYLESAMGYGPESDIGWVYHGTRGWTVPHVIGYMESHDEERMMYKNLQYGKEVDGYSVKNLSIALSRVKAASTIFYTIPGPKMLWQFGELGYDVSIDFGGRISNKPVKWEYRDEYARYRVYEHIADLIRLRHAYTVFTEGTATLLGGNNLVKQLTLKNSPYTTTPADASQMNVQVVVNFDVTMKSVDVAFPHTGTWYDYYAYGKPIVVTTATHTMQLMPGEYRIFTDVEITNPIITSTVEEIRGGLVSVYPNPVNDVLVIESDKPISRVRVVTLNGAVFTPTRLTENTWDVSGLKQGLHILRVEQPAGVERVKILKR
jgi:glycosidase